MKIERHAPGAPCWVDLETTDQAAAKSFYGATVAAVTAGGGSVAMPPTDIATVGRIAFVRDPQGAGLGLMVPESTD